MASSYALVRTLCIAAVLSGILSTSRAYAEQTGAEYVAELRSYLKEHIDEASSFNDKFEAQVWMMDVSSRLKKYVIDPKKRIAMAEAIHRQAVNANLRPSLVLAVIEIESHFDQYAVSHAGAMGLMQVMPFWKRSIGRPDDNLHDMETNLRYGCHILRFYLDKEDGKVAPALARYNGSYGRTTYSDKVIRVWKKRWAGRDP